MENPRVLDIFQPDTRIQMNTAMSMVKRRTIEQPRPSLLTVIGFMNTIVYSNHGSGNLDIVML